VTDVLSQLDDKVEEGAPADPVTAESEADTLDEVPTEGTEAAAATPEAADGTDAAAAAPSSTPEGGSVR
jgi:hypothetical protein